MSFYFLFWNFLLFNTPKISLFQCLGSLDRKILYFWIFNIKMSEKKEFDNFVLLKKISKSKEMILSWIWIRIHFFQCGSAPASKKIDPKHWYIFMHHLLTRYHHLKSVTRIPHFHKHIWTQITQIHVNRQIWNNNWRCSWNFLNTFKKKTYISSTNVSQLGFFVWAAIANIYNILLFYCMYLYVTLIWNQFSI